MLVHVFVLIVKALPCFAEAARSAMIRILRMLDMVYVFFSSVEVNAIEIGMGGTVQYDSTEAPII